MKGRPQPRHNSVTTGARGGTTTEHYTWSANVSTFPLVTPAVIDGEGRIGAALILTHVFVLDSSQIAASVGAAGTATPSTSNAS